MKRDEKETQMVWNDKSFSYIENRTGDAQAQSFTAEQRCTSARERAHSHIKFTAKMKRSGIYHAKRETNTHIKCKNCAWKWEEKACKIVHCVCAPELTANRWYCTFVLLNNNINSKKKKQRKVSLSCTKGMSTSPQCLHLQCNFIA